MCIGSKLRNLVRLEYQSVKMIYIVMPRLATQPSAPKNRVLPGAE